MATAPLSAVLRSAPGSTVVDVTGFDEFNTSVAVQADGKILVAGFSARGPEAEDGYDYSVVRLRANGTLDSTFGENGRALVSAGIPPDGQYDLAVQADGALLVSSAAFSASGQDYGVIRLNPDGTPDSAFNRNAQASIAAGIGAGDGAVSVADNGAVLLTTVGHGDQVHVMRLNADGTADSRFGDDGYLTFVSPVAFGGAEEVQVLANGQLLVAFNQFSDGFPYTLMRLDPDGSLDTRFGDRGLVVFDPDVVTDGHAGLTVQADGKIVVANNANSFDEVHVARLNADGHYDSGFGTGGVATVGLLGTFGSAHSVAIQADGKIIVGGETDAAYSVARLNADGSLDTTFASPDGKHHLDGAAGDDALAGLGSAETVRGLAGDDLLQGNGGADRLIGGEGADVFRFAGIGDSYRTASNSVSDHLLDFTPGQDRIDLAGLGLTGIGNGHGGTLAIKVNAAGTYTYLKSYDADANGHRFELVLKGALAAQLNDSNLLFGPVTLTGTGGRDHLLGTPVQEVLRGLGGNDQLNGGGGADVLIGGSGQDLLTGGSGNDVLRYTEATDSYRTSGRSFADLIQDFSLNDDVIDLSALGYTGLGDGTGHTLKVAYNPALNRTVLKDLDADPAGHRFEISLAGDLAEGLSDQHFVFAVPSEAAAITLLGGAAPDHNDATHS